MQGRLAAFVILGARLVEFDPFRLFAIFIAVLGAVALAVGAQFQNDAVGKSHSPRSKKFGSLSLKQIFALMRRPKWLTGTSFLVLAVALQLIALSLAPLLVVQPVGVVALIITSILNSKFNAVRLERATLISIVITMLGVGGFVTVASGVASQSVITDAKLLQVVGVLLGLLVVFGVMFRVRGAKTGALNYIFGAGMLYGFVASLAKVVIARLSQGFIDPLTLLATIALIAAAVLGGWFVQNAYSSGPPELVIAGLTVIDPIVAVLIAIVILGEASGAGIFETAAFIFAGIVAIFGVLMLARVHPQLSSKNFGKDS